MDLFTTLFLMSSGLFLGWSLGANDAGNILGAAVGSRMLPFRRAAIIGSVFVVIGAVAGVGGTSETLGRLGQIQELEHAFLVALSAALCILFYTRHSLPVSATQAIVGGILGWNVYTATAGDWDVLGTVAASWLASPVLAGLLSLALYRVIRKCLKLLSLHMFSQDLLLRWALALAGAFGAYSLGRNNIANVMGVFVESAPFTSFSIFALELSSVQALFFLGGLAIASGILSYSRKVMMTIGSDLYHLSPENALVAVLSVSLTLFLFSLPGPVQVPVSSSQAAVGAVIGVAAARGDFRVDTSMLMMIILGWILTPVTAGVFSWMLLTLFSGV
ncbi:inorganic phosphate transporter [Salinispira pacifica]|uniref:Putative low-affinity inorganic phosphate transporter n=1 Tax=Salinispira pacifica TaxID=1307761 RepID=V5WF12_9SPIO|nr:inorganic phosphate transporter [Salinispira pacifica]AHC13761.1 putative low-affinity inorganic phosphate transporter [Salinispira pacifica]